ncbi:MAG: cytochrome c-type biogenesis protein [Gemmatimonadota bacterium]
MGDRRLLPGQDPWFCSGRRQGGRRGFLRAGLDALIPPLAAQEPAPAIAKPGSGETGQLFDPGAVGRPRAVTSDVDNDQYIMGIEKRLRCACGCGLDIYTCRTTDFTCETSPRLHREIVSLRQQGMDAQAIIDAFVAEYGEKALMAPRPEGFNLIGYLLPGVAVLIAGVGLVAWIQRRKAAVAAANVAAGASARGSAPAASSGPVSAEDLERLRQALAEVED